MADATATTKKKVFTVKLADGKELTLAVRRPTPKEQEKAQRVHARAFREAVEDGAIVRAKLEAVLRQQQLWDDAKQKEWDDLRASLLANELLLKRGGVKKSEAKEAAIQMRRDRIRLEQLLHERNQLDSNTAEAMASQSQFSYLVSVCTVNPDTNQPYYKGHDDYLTREEDPVSFQAATAFGELAYGLDPEHEKKLPENIFLTGHGYANEKLRLIDKEGNLVDTDGKRIDEQGYRLNDQGERVDAHGNLLTEAGEYKVEFTPFLDD